MSDTVLVGIFYGLREESLFQVYASESETMDLKERNLVDETDDLGKLRVLLNAAGMERVDEGHCIGTAPPGLVEFWVGDRDTTIERMMALLDRQRAAAKARSN